VVVVEVLVQCWSCWISVAGNGGAGLASSITGSSVTRAGGGGGGHNAVEQVLEVLVELVVEVMVLVEVIM
jgi:hypothetical protein